MPEKMSKQDADLQYLTAMARRLKLNDEDTRKYVHKHMTRLGYRPEVVYKPGKKADQDDNGNGDDWSLFGEDE